MASCSWASCSTPFSERIIAAFTCQSMSTRRMPRPTLSLIRYAVVVATMLVATTSTALEVTFRPVADGVYAYIGDTGPRGVENEGLDADVGLVVTPAGTMLIDSGATSGPRAESTEAVKQVQPQPVKWVINTGRTIAGWAMAISRNRAPRSLRTCGCQGRYAGARWRSVGRPEGHYCQDQCRRHHPPHCLHVISRRDSHPQLGGMVFQFERPRRRARSPRAT